MRGRLGVYSSPPALFVCVVMRIHAKHCRNKRPVISWFGDRLDAKVNWVQRKRAAPAIMAPWLPNKARPAEWEKWQNLVAEIISICVEVVSGRGWNTRHSNCIYSNRLFCVARLMVIFCGHSTWVARQTDGCGMGIGFHNSLVSIIWFIPSMLFDTKWCPYCFQSLFCYRVRVSSVCSLTWKWNNRWN